MKESTRNEAASESTYDEKQNCNLQDSEFTVDSSETEHEASGSGWLGGMGTEFLTCLTENVSPVVSGVATLVHKTAVAVANEIAQLERDGELEAEALAAAEELSRDSLGAGGRNQYKETGDKNLSSSSFDSNTSEAECLSLPWEVRQETPRNSTENKEKDGIPVYITDIKMMKQIFALSRQESTFLEPFSNDSPENDVSPSCSLSSFSSKFAMSEPRLKLISRLLDIDKNLQAVHSRLTGAQGQSTPIFWKNYFFHCEKVRAEELDRREAGRATSPSLGILDSFGFASLKTDLESAKDEGVNDGGNDGVNDGESLVPVESDVEGQNDDDSSYVIQSAPNTGESFATTRSIDDDIIIVDTQEKLRVIRENKKH
ncbi:unnamed protein product [Pseudo-nitzschia multistriata]|uniref:BSD domain-containing protein n=1 Tax=Pseudo-nitzschia multistriata TaxID=183589 RepID=A0A448Z5H4_9STRA|nr:unnamed protein product [Pseudo-nitzschia multistriata]